MLPASEIRGSSVQRGGLSFMPNESDESRKIHRSDWSERDSQIDIIIVLAAMVNSLGFSITARGPFAG